MGFDKPKVMVRDGGRRTVRYSFNAPVSEPHDLDGEYYVRGGVCWPVILRQGSEMAAGGFVVLVGQNLVTGTRYVFEEIGFTCVDPVMDEDGQVLFSGVAGWFNRAWADWGCLDYYRHQADLTHRMYLLQMIRSKMVEPKPQFPEVEWKDERQVTPILWGMMARDQLKFQHQDKGGELHRQLRSYEIGVGEKLEDYPAVYALVCALCGMERAPWRPSRNSGNVEH